MQTYTTGVLPLLGEVRWGGFIGGDAIYTARVMLDINPAADNIWLSFANTIEGGYQIDVFNYTGVNVFTEKVSLTEAQHQINTTKLNNGIYFITITTNTETLKAKFTVIK